MNQSWSLALEALPIAVVVPLAAWGLIWKSIALWKAARRDQLGWYLSLLIINTAGILPIIYIFAVAPRHPELGASTGANVAET